MQRQKRAIGDLLDIHISKPRAHMGQISGFAGGVDHDKHLVAAARHHQIIQNAARRIGEKPVALAAIAQIQKIAGKQPFHRIGHGHIAIIMAQDHLTHVADVKKTCLGAGVQMLFHHAKTVLHRHRIARKRDHLAAKLFMQRMQWRVFEIAHRTTLPFLPPGLHLV